MHLRILGCGEAFDPRHGNNSALLTGKDIPTILFDCGYQIPHRLWALKATHKRIDGIYFTHLHADHAFGVVPLLMRYWEEGRKEPLRILGPTGVETWVHRAMNLGYPGGWDKLKFKIRFEEFKSGDTYKWGPLQFEVARSQHSVKNLAVRVIGPAGRSFGISGDGRPTDATIKLFRGVHVLLHESFTNTPQAENHADFQTLREAFHGSGIRRIGLTHISREKRTHMERLIYRYNWKEGTNWFVPKAGQTIKV